MLKMVEGGEEGEEEGNGDAGGAWAEVTIGEKDEAEWEWWKRYEEACVRK
jgi:hypothetical protein